MLSHSTADHEATQRPVLSVIVPFYNEEESIGPLYDAIVAAVAPLQVPFEMVFVDDGSKDGTLARGVQLAQRDSRVRMVKFRRNYGQTPAMAAGIEHARGDILVTMDGDLQNDPADIEQFLAKIAEGYDIVVGWRHRRQDKLITRKIPSKIANWLITRVTGVPITDNGCSLKAFRAAVIKSIPLYSEMHRFIPAMAWIAGPRIAEIRVRHHARQFGRSKYGLSRIYKVLIDLMVIKTIASFTARPLMWFGLLALMPLLLGLCAMGFGLVPAIAFGAHASLPLVGSGMIFVAAALFLLVGGVLGELVYRTGDVQQHRFAQLTMTASRKQLAP
ncbi:MAG TPA: glycosyltransferase family 2 protein [Steroidobacteraceae bacterium]|nr:glycosyltransferase family 2 protein [Steroidobacteraceae bacterium]